MKVLAAGNALVRTLGAGPDTSPAQAIVVEGGGGGDPVVKWLTHYFSAEDLGAAGDRVDAWPSRNENLTLIMAVAERRPTVGIDSGGKKYLQFAGSGDSGQYLWAEIQANCTQPVTIFVVGMSDVIDTDYRYLVDGTPFGPVGARLSLYEHVTLGLTAWAGGTERGTGSQGIGKKFIFGATFDGAATRTRRAGVADVVGSAGTQTFQGITVGNRYAPASIGDYWQGRIYGVAIALGYAATEANQDELVAFLTTNHGAPEP